MKSTLPALFRFHSKEKSQMQTISPEKQSQYYKLNLTISHNYRTKIINPHHQKSQAVDKIPQRFKNPSKTARYSQYPSRSLSVQHSYQPSTQNQSELLFDQNKTTNISKHKKNKISLQQFDNVRAQIKKVRQQAFILRKSMQDIPQLHEAYLNELNMMGQKINKQIDSTQKQIKDNINSMWQMLSSLRRQTNLEIKAMKRDLGILYQQVHQQSQLIKDIEAQRATLKKINF